MAVEKVPESNPMTICRQGLERALEQLQEITTTAGKTKIRECLKRKADIIKQNITEINKEM